MHFHTRPSPRTERSPDPRDQSSSPTRLFISAGLALLGLAVTLCLTPPLALAQSAGALPPAAKSAVGAWTVEPSPISRAYWELLRFQRTVPPGGPLDRIAVTRYRQLPRDVGTLLPAVDDNVANQPKTVVLYLPGTFMNGGLPEAADEEPDLAPLHAWVAQDDTVVYALDYRTHAIPVDAAPVDASFAVGWTTEVFVVDALAALDLALNDSGADQAFVMGFSRGVAYAYAVAAARPNAVAGVVALDGYFKRRPAPGEVTPDHSSITPEALASRLAETGLLQDVGGSRGWEERQSLMTAALRDDEASRQLLAQVLHRAWGPGALTRPQEVPAADGSIGPETGASPVRRLAAMMLDYDRFFPAIQDLQSPTFISVADAEHVSLDDGWPTLSVPVIYFGTPGLGPDALLAGIHSAAHCAGRQAQIHLLEDYGHLDVLTANDRETRVLAPIRAFLNQHAPTPSTANTTVINEASTAPATATPARP